MNVEVMARKPNIEHLERFISSADENRRVFQLIGFPDQDGDYSSTLIRCVPKSIGRAFRHYGDFSNDEITIISHLTIGSYKNWGAERCMVIRIA